MREILVVDDDPEFRRFLEDVLGHYGYSVLAAENGSDGLSIIEERHPDAVVVDLVMPPNHMTGLELLRAIKQDSGLKAMPTVVVTGQGQPEEEESFLCEGANAFFTKPVPIGTLTDCLDALIDERVEQYRSSDPA